jgi:hypothetical protein
MGALEVLRAFGETYDRFDRVDPELGAAVTRDLEFIRR